MDTLERTLKALADKNRLRIIGLLSRRKLCVCELAEVLKITQPSVSKHLKKLKQAGIVESEQDGFWTNYFLSINRKTCSVAVMNLIEQLLASEAQLKADLREVHKTDRKKLCCR